MPHHTTGRTGSFPGDRVDIAALARELVAIDGLYPSDGHLSLALYRLLAGGRPVRVEHLASSTGRSQAEVARWLGGVRAELDEHGDIVAFHGLSLRQTRIRLEADGQALYSWCAGDVFLIHDVLRRPVQARCADPITGDAISISLADGQARRVSPATVVVSMVRADAEMGDGIVPDACGPINFFGSEESGRAFVEQARGSFCSPLRKASSSPAISTGRSSDPRSPALLSDRFEIEYRGGPGHHPG